MIARITKSLIDELGAGDVAWDVDVRGFGIRCRRAHGRRRYVLKYDFKGRQRFYTIGPHGSPWTPEMARAEARRLLGELAAGRDPSECRDAEKGIPTLAGFAERYLEQHARLKKKPATVENDRAIFRLHLVPALGRHRLDAITRPHVLELQASLAETPGNANNVLGLLSSVFTVAFRWGVLDERRGHANPVKYVQKFPMKKRQRFLTEDELARVGRALEELQHDRPWHVAAILLLALTGARPSEVLSLRWENVDVERKVLRLQGVEDGPEGRAAQRRRPRGAVTPAPDPRLALGTARADAGGPPGVPVPCVERHPEVGRAAEGDPALRPASHVREPSSVERLLAPHYRRDARSPASGDHAALRPPAERAPARGGGPRRREHSRGSSAAA